MSAAIAFGYEAWIVKTKKNDVYSGFIIADGEIITLKESSGEQRTIAAKDIVLRKKQTMSIMPDNVALGLTALTFAYCLLPCGLKLAAAALLYFNLVRNESPP